MWEQTVPLSKQETEERVILSLIRKLIKTEKRMEKEQWPGTVTEKSCTAWKCPTCGQGIVTIIEGTFQSAETAETKNYKHEDYFEYEWITYVFTVRGKCSYTLCNEEFVISGKGRVEQQWSNYSNTIEEFNEIFTPKIIIPMPQLINIPEKTPDKVKQELEATFAVFLLDPYAAAGRIRVALEGLMDYYKIKKTTRIEGKTQKLDLHNRIDKFKKKNLTIGNKLMAIKWLGNTGSHLKDTIKIETMRSDVLDALEIIEYCLEELIEKRSTIITKKATEIEKRHKKKNKNKKIKEKERF